MEEKVRINDADEDEDSPGYRWSSGFERQEVERDQRLWDPEKLAAELGSQQFDDHNDFVEKVDAAMKSGEARRGSQDAARTVSD